MFQNTIKVETGLSDFHMMTVSVLKTSYRKCKRKLFHFSNESFRCELMPLLCNESLSNEMSNDNFIEIVDNVLSLNHLNINMLGRMTSLL